MAEAQRPYCCKAVTCAITADFVEYRLSHIASFLLPALLLLPFMSLLILQGAQWYLKESAEERMEHHPLVTLSFPAADAVWHKQGKELNIEGKLFDVQQYSVSNGTLTATGFYDEKESEIIDLFTLLTQGNKTAALLHFFLMLQCFIAPLLFISCGPAYQENANFSSFFSFFLPHPLCLMEEQPPRW